MKQSRVFVLFGVIFSAAFLLLPGRATASEPAVPHLGNRLELFVDANRIEKLNGVSLNLHSPKRMEAALKFNKPWEGLGSAYVTVFKDGDIYRMYYRGWANLTKVEMTCYAESKDGILWTKPNLGLFEFNGSKENNIVWKKGFGSHNFTPFKDTKPGVEKNERYKAFGRAPKGTKGLLAFASADGIHWRLLAEQPVLTDGAFDSQNLGFWDTNRKQYVAYFRIFTKGVRGIAYAVSDDFIHWSETKPIDLGNTPPEHFYTNATTSYFRAPHYYFAFPKRFARSRKKFPDHKELGISEAVFLSSRDGVNFDRTFMEALIRPGRNKHNWGDRSTMVAWGILQTASDEMSIYYSQGYRYPTHHLERGVFRLDGIASAHAGYKGGELITKPFQFAGNKLVLNYSTSASGSVRVEIQDSDGKPIPGFTFKDSKELYGDEIAEAYSWKSGNDVSKLAGKTVRLRFMLKDCDVYSYRFAE
jgi:hypothetical protein